MLLTEEIMHTQFMIRSMNITHWIIQRILTNRRKNIEETVNGLYKILFDFETIAPGEKHMPYLCLFQSAPRCLS